MVSCTAQTGGVCSVPSRASIRVYPEISNGFTAASATLPSAVANASAQESSDKVGASAGKFRVNESGAATYTMPLTLLAGTAGVEPPLSFHYNSQGGSGPMGRGWSIGGLSAIERCRQTLHQDRKAMPITWSDKDRFCLDGQRLVLDDPVNGTYGAVGTVYRTELDSFAKVTSVGGGPGPGNPDHFKVERKDGSVSYYGATPHTSDTDAKLLNSSTSTSPKTFRWALKKFSDSVGNPIWYIYTNDDNGQRIKEVRYAYGATETKPKAFRAAVTFAHAATARTDASKAHVAGYGFVNDKLLTKVTVKSGPELTATEIRHYKLSYQADNTVTEDKVTRLAKIEECKDTTCYLDTEFTWPDPVSPFPAGTPAAASSFTLTDSGDRVLLNYELADINGDGAADIVWQAFEVDQDGADTDHELRFVLSKGGKLVEGAFSGGGSRIILEENYADTTPGASRMAVLDYNADGRQDVAVFHHGNSVWHIFPSTYSSSGWRLSTVPVITSVTDEHVTFADVDSDGLVDAVRATAAVAATAATKTTAAIPAKPAGLAVRYLRRRDPATLPAAEQARAYHFARETTLPYMTRANETTETVGGVSLLAPNSDTILQPAGDFNGDGKSELYLHFKTVLQVEPEPPHRLTNTRLINRLVTLDSAGNARTLISSHFSSGISNYTADGLVFGDINGDGLTDLLYVPAQRHSTDGIPVTAARQVKYWINTGAANTAGYDLDTLLASAPTMSLPWDTAATSWNRHPPPRLVDMNRDGFLDLVWHDTGANAFMVAYWNGPTARFGAALALFSTPVTSHPEKHTHLLLDRDGDGWMDRLHLDLESVSKTLKAYASANQGAASSVITGITNGLDAVTTIDYATLSDATVYERLGIGATTEKRLFCPLPSMGSRCSVIPYKKHNLTAFYDKLNGPWLGEDRLGNNAKNTARKSPVLELIGSMPVVKKVTGSAPGWKLASTGASGNSNNAGAVNSISYRYGQAKIQASGRGFLGFERLKTIDEQTNVTTTTQYRQDFPYIGRPLSTEVRTAGGKLLRKSTSTWKLQRPAGATVASMAATARADGTAKLGALRPVLSKTEEFRYALDTTSTPATQSALSKVVTTNTHDGFGNLDKIVTETKLANDSLVARQTTTNLYHDTGFGTEAVNRRAGRLSKSTVKTERSRAGTTTLDSNTRIATFDYYDSGDTRGLLQTETVQPGTHEQLITTHTYDSRGNTEKVASVGKVGKAGTTATQERYTEFVYDADKRYLKHTKESFGGVSYQFNKVLKRDKAGRVERSQSVAPDGTGTAASQETGMAYGALGRPFLEYNTSTGARSTTYYSAAVTGVCPDTAQYRTETRSASGGISQVCYDRLAREVRRRSKSFDGAEYYQVDTQYDILGRVKRVSEPHPSDAMTIHWTENEYDILGRLTRIDHPHTTSDTTIVYSADSSVTGAVEKVVTTNAKGQVSTEYRNALGEVVKVENPETASVTYAYDAAGNLKQTVANGVTTTISYDVLGRKQSMTDPDKGQWSYQYNAFGELVEQTSANGVVSTLTHDAQGRRLSRTDARSATTLNATTWSYDTQTMADTVAAPGQLTRTVHTISSGEQVGSHSVALAYDTLGRLMGREVIIDGNAALTFEEQYTYDQYGRPFQKFDASDDFAGVRYHYNSAGYLAKISESAEAVPATPEATTTAPVAYYTVTAMNARGQVTRATLGNGVVLDRTYQADSGYLHTMKATNGTSQELQKLTLSFDELGNLTKRHDQGLSKLMGAPAKNMEEVFTYDNLNRLLTTRIAGEASANVDTTHDARGNIKTKSGVGAYAYGAASNRLVSVTPSGGTAVTYAYDSNGNLTSGDGRTLSYTSFDKPHTITKGTDQTVKFAYDGERARYKRSVTTGTGTNAVTTTTYYVGNVEIRNVTGGKQYTRYVESHAIVKLTRNDTSRSAISTDYLITDHLGSIDAIANSSGALLHDLSFDAWGRRRAADSSYAIINTPATALATLNTLTPRGFTGHEMLDTVGLIHMNGRVYDPRLGRFTTADPIVQFPHYSQSFNHYSYVLNNPLGYTDPSGYGIEPFTVFRIIAAVVLSYACNGVCAPEVWAWAFGSIGGIEAAANGGNSGEVATAAFSSAALAYVGAEYGLSGGEFTSIEALQFGALGGITSVLQGGKFGHGFVAAGLGAAAGSIPGLEGTGFQAGFTRVLVSSVVGGTISEITGDKFANGAAYGAFASIVREGVADANRSSSLEQKTLSCSGTSSCREAFKKYYEDNGVRMQQFESFEVLNVKETLSQNQDAIDAIAVRNLTRETEGIMFSQGAASTIGAPGGNSSQLSLGPFVGFDPSGQTIILHFHPNRNQYGTQLLPSVSDLQHSIRNNTIMVNVNPRDTSRFLIYRGVPAR